VTDEQIAKLRALRGQGLTSAVGEYTPDELWEALDEIERLRALLAAPAEPVAPLLAEFVELEMLRLELEQRKSGFNADTPYNSEFAKQYRSDNNAFEQRRTAALIQSTCAKAGSVWGR
jgi:hypothetical protein